MDLQVQSEVFWLERSGTRGQAPDGAVRLAWLATSVCGSLLSIENRREVGVEDLGSMTYPTGEDVIADLCKEKKSM